LGEGGSWEGAGGAHVLNLSALHALVRGMHSRSGRDCTKVADFTIHSTDAAKQKFSARTSPAVQLRPALQYLCNIA